MDFNYLTSILNRYFCKVFLSWFAVCLSSIMIVVGMIESTEYARRALARPNISTSMIIEMVFLKMPSHLEVLLPFVVLLTTLLVFWKLHRNHELVIARTSGVSIWQCISGLSWLMIIIGVFEVCIVNRISAAMQLRLHRMESMAFAGKSNHLAVAETGIWLKEVYQNNESIIHARSANLDKGIFYDVNFYIYDGKSVFVSAVTAKQVVLNGSNWLLRDASLTQGQVTAQHSQITIPTDFTLKKIQNGYFTPQSLSFWKISDYIHILEKSGLSPIAYNLYWHRLIARIGLMLGMILLGTAFSLGHPVRGINFFGIAVALGIGFLIYFIRDVIYALGLANELPILLAAWAPSFLTILIAASLILHYEER